MPDIFQFKQFSIQQDHCAMKIGTDGVLLGAWAPIDHRPESILDIGAGTGLIALMLAQRSATELIDGLEIDPSAYEQCVTNFENSPWSDRLFCYHASLEEFTEQIDDRYDLIVSNPPFHSGAYKSNSPQRNIARFTEALPFDQLLQSAAHLLSETGIFALIVPFKSEQEVITLASEVGLFPQRLMRIKGHENAPVKRSLIAFSFQQNTLQTEALVIEIERHRYTSEYKALTREFYLKMD